MKAIGSVSDVVERYINMDQQEIEKSQPAKKETPPLVARFIEAPEYDDQGYIHLNEIGGIYPARDILDVTQGSISAWLKSPPPAHGSPIRFNIRILG